MKTYLKSLYDWLFGHLATKADVENIYSQLAALLEVKNIVGEGIRLGPLRGWALSPDALAIVLHDIVTRRNPRVVEFGSGESTIAIAATLKRLGGFLVTIEHDRAFADQILNRLQRNQLADVVQLHLVPLRTYESRRDFGPFTSYDLSDFDTEFEVALVDGPVTPRFGAAARIVPLEWSVARLANQRAVYVDDALRAEERKLLDGLLMRWQNVDVENLVAEKGMCRLTYRPL